MRPRQRRLGDQWLMVPKERCTQCVVGSRGSGLSAPHPPSPLKVRGGGAWAHTERGVAKTTSDTRWTGADIEAGFASFYGCVWGVGERGRGHFGWGTVADRAPTVEPYRSAWRLTAPGLLPGLLKSKKQVLWRPRRRRSQGRLARCNRPPRKGNSRTSVRVAMGHCKRW